MSYTEPCLRCAPQNGVESSTGAFALGDNVLKLEEQKALQMQKEELEKELYHCTKAHKMSILQSAYELSKLQVSFISLKRQESLAKENLEDALRTVDKLQTNCDSLKSQLRHIESENGRLKSTISTLSSELDKRTAEKESLQRALEAAKVTDNSVKSVDVEEMVTEDTVPLTTQHELQTEQLLKTDCNMTTGEKLVTDQNILEKWTPENETLHSYTIQIQELEQKLASSERLESDLATSKLDLEKVIKEKEELFTRLEATTSELLECKKRIAETELHDAELGRYAQVLNVEKLTLIGQLELLRGELVKQEEAARIAQIGATKVMEAERECAKALKLVEEKEEEIEYYTKQIESLREKNNMLRTQHDMEQLCKEAEMAAMPKLHEQSINLPSRNLDASMELEASNSTQNPQKMPPEPTKLHIAGSIAEAIETNKASNDCSRPELLEHTSNKGKGSSTTESQGEMASPKSVAVQPPANLPTKRSSRLRNQSNMQHLMDSSSAATGARKRVVDLEDDNDENDSAIKDVAQTKKRSIYNDENDGVLEDVTQTKKRSTSRLKRPSVPVPKETETFKKKGRKTARRTVCPTASNDTDVELGPAHLLARSNLNARSTPLQQSTTPRTRSKLPR